MSFPRYAALYAIMFATFLAVDGVWLAVVARGFYRRNLGDLMRSNINWGAALAFYLLFVVGVLVFAVLPGADSESLLRAVGLGALFGFLAYATYDLTNLATIEGWPAIVSYVDMVWGAVLSGIVATAGYYAARWLA